MFDHRSLWVAVFACGVNAALWAGEAPAGPPAEHTLKALRQVSVAELGGPAKGVLGLGRAPKSIGQFKGRCITYLVFDLPGLPKGRGIVRARLRLHADYISSKKYMPSASAVVVKGALPKRLRWDRQPDVIALTATRGVRVPEPGPFALEFKEGLTPGQQVTLRVVGGGGGYRWMWWKAAKTPELDIWTGPAESIISLMPASRDVPLPPDKKMPSLLPAWRKLRTVPILQYYWPKCEDDAALQAWLADYIEMGFTGTYKSDKTPPTGGRLFRDKGLHGFMLQSNFANRGEPVLGPDGKPAPFPGVKRLGGRRHPICNSVFSPANVETYYAYLIRFGRDYGLDNLFQVGDTIVMSSWDETGLYTRKFMEYGYTARDEFIRYLTDVVFKDTHPHKDTNGDGRTFVGETGLAIDDWSQVVMPSWPERYQRPGLWRHWIDFHAYYTYLFFRRGALVMEKAFRRPVELFAFSHATAKWVGRTSSIGLDLYWQSKLNRILTVEDCQDTYPGSNIHYYWTDQLSRRYKLPVMGWSWWWPDAKRSTDPLAFGRALARAMGHNCHGLNFWVYTPSWGEKPAARAACAHWHRVFQAHWEFLRNATVPVPQVAIVRPRNTANMYPKWTYPKRDQGWTVAALTEAQIPFEIIADNQVEHEPNVLDDYKVLLMPTAAWESPRFLALLGKFLDRGGYVYTTGDSFMKDNVTGREIDFLSRRFGIRPTRKHKCLFAPSYDSAAEYLWRMEHASTWQRPKWGESGGRGFEKRLVPLVVKDADLASLRGALPEVSGTGLPQALLDPRAPQWIEGKAAGLPARHRTFHDIITGDVQPGGTVLATYGGQVCAVETKRTVWTGFRAGIDHACRFPLKLMRQWGEPVWPFEAGLGTDAAGRAGARDWITRIVRKAGVKPWVRVTRQGAPAPHIEVHLRKDPHGDAMLFIINHERLGGPCRFEGDVLRRAEAIAELRTGTRPERAADGSIRLTVPPFDVAIIAAGSKAFVDARLAAHRAIKKDVAPMPVFTQASAK